MVYSGCVEGKGLSAPGGEISHLHGKAVVVAAVFLGTHIVTVELRHGGMENVHIACLMLVAVAFMRAVSEVGHLLLLFGNTEFQAEPGKEREGGIPLSIHRNPDFPVAVYGPYGMQSQEGLDEHRCYGEITGNGNNTLVSASLRSHIP